MKIRHLIPTLLIFFTGICAGAQDNELMTLKVEARLDYTQEYISSDKVHDNSGFKGKYFQIRLDGKISDKISYSYRQRLNRAIVNSTVLDATDWLTLTYKNSNWSISGGKQVVAIGGFEYDRSPIDLYFCSEYWNNIACYQFGASAAYSLPSGNDSFMFQFCESPFRKSVFNLDNRELFAYNLMWNGSHGVFSSIYSLNMIEYLPGRFINYIAAGNRFDLGNFTIELDLMNRAVSLDKFFGKDMSVMAEVSWKPIEQLNIFAKVTHDMNLSGETGDFCVADGTSITRAGGGIEYYPIKGSRNLRLHLNCCYTDGRVPSTTVLRPQQTIIDGGITWTMNMLNIKRK